jgi:hypothetical protein
MGASAAWAFDNTPIAGSSRSSLLMSQGSKAYFANKRINFVARLLVARMSLRATPWDICGHSGLYRQKYLAQVLNRSFFVSRFRVEKFALASHCDHLSQGE